MLPSCLVFTSGGAMLLFVLLFFTETWALICCQRSHGLLVAFGANGPGINHSLYKCFYLIIFRPPSRPSCWRRRPTTSPRVGQLSCRFGFIVWLSQVLSALHLLLSKLSKVWWAFSPSLCRPIANILSLTSDVESSSNFIIWTRCRPGNEEIMIAVPEAWVRFLSEIF